MHCFSLLIISALLNGMVFFFRRKKKNKREEINWLLLLFLVGLDSGPGALFDRRSSNGLGKASIAVFSQGIFMSTGRSPLYYYTTADLVCISI